MKDEIVNRVAQSKLITFDLEELYPEGKRVLFDIKDWLYEGLILKEKEFRTLVENFNWVQYQDNYVALTCSTDAIIPGWAYMLIASKLSSYVKSIVVGDLEYLEATIYQKILDNLDLDSFKDKPVIIKGCSNKPVPENAYITAITQIQYSIKTQLLPFHLLLYIH